MDKVNCEIIQDLLPLYVDDVCSQSSKQVVEEHLESCHLCKEKAQEIKNDDITIHLAEEKNESFKKLATHIRIRKACLILSCILIAFVIAIVGNRIYEHFAYSTDQVISYNKVNIIDVCQLSDGRIAFHTIVDDGYRVNGVSWTDNTPYPQISLERGKIKIKNHDKENEIKAFTLNDCYWVFGAEQGKISYIDEKGNEQLIWEKNDIIPTASEDMEKLLINRKDGAVQIDFE